MVGGWVELDFVRGKTGNGVCMERLFELSGMEFEDDWFVRGTGN